TVVANGMSSGVNQAMDQAMDQAAERLQAIAPAAAVARASRQGAAGDTNGRIIRASSVARLGAVFESLDYDLERIRMGHGVPRVFLNRMPADLSDTVDAEERKALFIATTLPLILQVNETIRHNRQRIADLRLQWRDSGTLAAVDRHWLEQMAKRYRVDGDLAPSALFEALLWRVDTVPVSMALAQAAIESGWGTSRFAQEGNALFGQWTWDESAGLVPEDRADDASHAVRAFDRLLESVRAYAHNLNTGWAYESFRDRRASLRASGTAPGGLKLAMTLDRYSEKGEAYVRMVHSIIRANGLQPFDHARLSQGEGQDSLGQQPSL
ncbi:MAG: glucosaminidase domain-containing protein, partial [Alphaproteobacteria bacterium]